MGEDRREQGEEPQFSVDEDWKKSVAEERERLREERPDSGQEVPREMPAPDFQIFLAGLYTQTLMCLGEVENPVSEKIQRDLPEAQYLIDTVEMLKQKTEGNLSEEEDRYLGNLLHDLRMRYVNAAAESSGEQKRKADKEQEEQDTSESSSEQQDEQAG